MTVRVNLIDYQEKKGDEYAAGCKLRDIFSKFAQSVIGDITIVCNAKIFGQTVSDFDIIVFGELQGYSLNLKVKTKDANEKVVESLKNVNINSFVIPIELKNHSSNGVYRIGTNIFVKYKTGDHNVTEQSEEQRYSLKGFFDRHLSKSPYIHNLIWFNGMNNVELNDLFKEGIAVMENNCIPSNFSIKDLMQKVVGARIYKEGKPVYVDNYDFDYNGIQRALKLFTKVKEASGSLTRSRVEQISTKISGEVDYIVDDKLTIYRGKAGAGKTVHLIRKALYLCDELDTRALILTYNKALVSDIRRLFAFADVPDMMSPNAVEIMTQHKYFYHVINNHLYKGELDSEDFVENYEVFLEEFYEFLKDESTKEQILTDIRNDYKLNWEYVLIDEAQDWSRNESLVISSLFDKDKIVVADGGQQFVRYIENYDWNSERNKTSIKLKECLRQKKNLVSFCDYVSKEYLPRSPFTKNNENMIGGKVIIVANKDKFFDVYKKEEERTINSENIYYDILCLVPHDMVEHDGENHFKYGAKFKMNNISFWDGTNEAIRSSYSENPNEIRILQYESCRGLEGWLVVCLGFDTFVNNKLNEYETNNNEKSFVLQSKEEQLNKYLLNWILMPLTRAIDTSIIVLDDLQSPISKKLKKIADEHKDYVDWIE